MGLLGLICAGYVPLASQSSYPIIVCSVANREGKSLRHVAKVAKFLDDNKPIKSLESLFALFQTSPILFNFV